MKEGWRDRKLMIKLLIFGTFLYFDQSKRLDLLSGAQILRNPVSTSELKKTWNQDAVTHLGGMGDQGFSI